MMKNIFNGRCGDHLHSFEIEREDPSLVEIKDDRHWFRATCDTSKTLLSYEGDLVAEGISHNRFALSKNQLLSRIGTLAQDFYSYRSISFGTSVHCHHFYALIQACWWELHNTLALHRPFDKTVERETRISGELFPWRFVRTADLETEIKPIVHNKDLTSRDGQLITTCGLVTVINKDLPTAIPMREIAAVGKQAIVGK